MNEKRILLMLHNRDEQALKAIIAEYGVLCRSVALDILKDEQDVEECVSDTLLTVWNAIPPANPDNFRAYLLKILRNQALNRYKAKQRGKRGSGQYTVVLDELAEVLPAPLSTEASVEQRELFAAITKYLGTLTQKQRDLFIRRYWSFSSFADLAKDFHMTENNVKVTLTRLRKRLMEYLKQEGFL